MIHDNFKNAFVEAPETATMIAMKSLGEPARVLKQEPAKIDIIFLKQFEEFKEFRAIRPRKSAGEKESEEEPDTTPEEALASAYQRLRNELADDLLQQLKAGSPTRFENIVVDLLVAKGIMGAEMQYLGLHDWLINQSSGPLPS